MKTEIMKNDSQAPMISIQPGPISLDGLTPDQQNELRMLAAKKGIDLAADAAKKKLQLQAATAEVDVAICAAKQLADVGARISLESSSQTATGTISIKAKKGLFI